MCFPKGALALVLGIHGHRVVRNVMEGKSRQLRLLDPLARGGKQPPRSSPGINGHRDVLAFSIPALVRGQRVHPSQPCSLLVKQTSEVCLVFRKSTRLVLHTDEKSRGCDHVSTLAPSTIIMTVADGYRF